MGNGGRFTLNDQGLTIKPTQWIDSGMYTCRANNSLGNAETSAHLAIYSEYSEYQPFLASTVKGLLKMQQSYDYTLLLLSEKS